MESRERARERERERERGNETISSKNPFVKSTFILKIRIPSKTTSFLFDAAIIIKKSKSAARA